LVVALEAKTKLATTNKQGVGEGAIASLSLWRFSKRVSYFMGEGYRLQQTIDLMPVA
jgi:hypothetical protein